MKMKKLLAGVLCFGLATFALTGCGGDKQDADQPQDEQQQVEQQPAEGQDAAADANAPADQDANAPADQGADAADDTNADANADAADDGGRGPRPVAVSAGHPVCLQLQEGPELD